MDSKDRLAYRPDIDGLRAVAVISVVLFHIEKRLVPGGFAGVDIFFVISGYLITLLIYSQIRNGNFCFAAFYRRRINRIIPPLFVMIAVVLAFGLAILSPTDLTRLFKGAVAAAAAVSNIYFWREYGNYFNGGVDEAALLHTWSLGVEEQFYIIWPILLLALARLRPTALFISIMLGLLAAVVASELGVRVAASASYYLLPTRFFELMTGGALAILICHKGAPFSFLASTVCGLAGSALMFGSLFFLTEAAPFPGVNALYPCLGTALLIASGANSRTLTARALSAKPMVFIGLISYSLYLWHWPVIAYATYLEIPITLVSGVLIFAGSIVIAFLSWKFVEIPFRRSGAEMTFAMTAGRRYVMPLTMLAFASVAVIGNGGLPGRFDPRVVEYEKIIATAPEKLHHQCHSPTFFYQRALDSSCILGASSKPAEMILIGDSYANHFTGMVDVLARQDDVAVMHYTMDGCMPLKEIALGPSASYAEKCRSRNRLSYDIIASGSYKYVILAASWPNDGTAAYFARLHEGLRDSVSSILSAGAKPIIILNNQGTTNANCPIRRLLFGSADSCDTVAQPNGRQRLMFETLKREFPTISYIDPNKAICDGGHCHAIIDNVPLYRDSGHLNDIGSRLIGRMLVEKGISLLQGDPSPSIFESSRAVVADQGSGMAGNGLMPGTRADAPYLRHQRSNQIANTSRPAAAIR
ncbi:acyltransferase|uniref:acyltransferase family protein n=1 Tax=Noviherbaspirillum sp. L7-7A TaxID=2850560 RepID=UPI001C2BFF5F|nr:acyltransferase family protein [Noviherbaspirillum sp. L7-7A]MBV0877936.1 acyltransferase [Noviherbaspirillum sp. L7-7A]